EEAIGNLDQDARAVGELGIPAHCAAVREVAQHRQALLDDGVRLLALDVRDEAYAASVVLVVGGIEPLTKRKVGQGHDWMIEYTVTALQRQWLRGRCVHRRPRAAPRGRSTRAP